MKNPTIIFSAPGHVGLEAPEQPRPAPGQLLVKTRMTLISTGTELTILSGEFPRQSAWSEYGQFPFVAGYHNVGVVEGLGEGADASWMGKRVFSMGPHAAWTCPGAGEAWPIPDGVPDNQAVFYTLALVAMNGLRRGRVAWGESVAVFGLGLVGQLTARFCALTGAFPVIGIDISPARLALLPQIPGVHAVDAGKLKAEDAVRELTRGRMADVICEVTGAPDLIAAEFKALRPLGRALILSSPRGPSSFDFHDLCNSPSLQIIGAHMMSCPPMATPDDPWSWARYAELFFDYLATGALDLRPLISSESPFEEGPALYRSLLKDRSQAMGLLLRWT